MNYNDIVLVARNMRKLTDVKLINLKRRCCLWGGTGKSATRRNDCKDLADG